MTFEAILDQAIAMLQRRGRATYRALKAQFQLDDELLETLKDELLFSQPVVDEDGRGLVWTGETEDSPVTPSQPEQPKPQSVVEQIQPAQVASAPVEPHVPGGEARASQVTGPSSSYVLRSNTPPDMAPSLPNNAEGYYCLRCKTALSASGKMIGFGAAVPRPARSHTYASPTPSLGSAQGLLLTRVGSPLARQDSHLLDDRQSFMVASQPPIPFDQPCLVALALLSLTIGVSRM